MIDIASRPAEKRGAGTRRRFGRFIRIALIVAAALSPALPGVAHADEKVVLLGLNFPPQVASAQRGETHNFEKEYPGLGYSVEYRQPDWRIDVYIYDLQKKSIPDGIDSDPVKQELARSKDEIYGVARSGRYTRVDFKSDYTIPDARQKPRLLCSVFAFGRQDASDLDSFLCVTGWKNRFVKFRLTTIQHAGSEPEARSFLSAWIKSMWPN